MRAASSGGRAGTASSSSARRRKRREVGRTSGGRPSCASERAGAPPPGSARLRGDAPTERAFETRRRAARRDDGDRRLVRPCGAASSACRPRSTSSPSGGAHDLVLARRLARACGRRSRAAAAAPAKVDSTSSAASRRLGKAWLAPPAGTRRRSPRARMSSPRRGGCVRRSSRCRSCRRSCARPRAARRTGGCRAASAAPARGRRGGHARGVEHQVHAQRGAQAGGAPPADEAVGERPGRAQYDAARAPRTCRRSRRRRAERR